MGRLKKEGPQVALIRSYRALQEQKKFAGFSGRGYTQDRRGARGKLLRKYKKTQGKPAWAFSRFFGTPTHLLLAGGSSSTGNGHKFTSRFNLESNKWEDHNEISCSCRILPVGGSARGIAYIIGGAEKIRASTYAISNTGEYYHKGTHTWTTFPLERPVWQAASAVKGDKIYITGGDKGSGALYPDGKAYDIVNKQWNSMSNMNTARRYHMMADVPDKPYIIVAGGFDNTNILSSAERYNPKDNTWTAINPMPTAKYGAQAVGIGSKVYVIGGTTTGGAVTKSVYVYDDATKAWSNGTDMNSARSFSSATVYDGKIYVVGGKNATSTSLKTGEIYDPTTSPPTWTNMTSNLKYGHHGGQLLII